jgi:hypothetical protein
LSRPKADEKSAGGNPESNIDCSRRCSEMDLSSDQFVVDESGKRTAVLLDLKRYAELLEAQEELESIRAYDEAKASDDEAVPFSQAVSEIERERG